MTISNTGTTWLLGGIVLIVVGTLGYNAVSGGLVSIVFDAIAIAGWVIAVTGIVKWFRSRQHN